MVYQRRINPINLSAQAGPAIMLKLDKNGHSICYKRAKRAMRSRNRLINAQSFNKSIEKYSAVIYDNQFR
jgi:hypothetical protein